MRRWLPILLVNVLLVACSAPGAKRAGGEAVWPVTGQPKSAAPAAPNRPGADAPTAPPRYPQVTPITPVQGRVVSVNERLRFVIVDFAFQQMPRLEQRLGVYRDDQRVGEVRISGPANGTSIVADVMSGVADRGDLVRED